MNGVTYNRIEIQPRYELIPKFGNQRKTEYIADFALYLDNDLIEVIDVKGMATTTAKLKAKLFRYKYPEVKLTWICKEPKYTGLEWIEYEELIKVRRKERGRRMTEHREEIVTVNAKVKIKCKFPVWLNNHTTVEDEKRNYLM